MALPGVRPAVLANKTKNPVATRRTGGEGDGNGSSSVKRTATAAVRTSSAASASNGKRATQARVMRDHYAYNDGYMAGLRARPNTTGTVGATRPSGIQYGTDLTNNTNYRTFRQGVAGNAQRRFSNSIKQQQQQYSNPYAMFNAMQNPYGFGMNNAQAGAILGKGFASVAGLFLNKNTAALENIGGNQNVYAEVNNNVKLSNTVKAGSSSPLESMKAADDSAELASAIAVAKGEQANVSQQLKEISDNLVNLENQKAEAEKNIEGLEKQIDAQQEKVDAKQETVDAKEKGVKDKQGEVKTAKQSVDSCQKKLDSLVQNECKAENLYKQARSTEELKERSLSTAEGNLASAESKLSSTSEYITGPNGEQVKNPLYDAAKAAVETAKQQVEQVRTELDQARVETKKQADAYKDAQNMTAEAKESFEAAQSRLEKAEQSETDAKAALDEAKGELETAKQELQTEQDKLDQLEQQKGAEQAKIDEYEEAVDTKKDLEKQYSDYEKEIPKQEQRLTKLQQKEDKELSGIDKEIQNAENKAQSLRDKGKEDKAKEFDAKAAGLKNRKTELQNCVAQRNLISEAGQNGQILRSGFVNGEKVYMIGDKTVDKAAFDAAKVPVKTEAPAAEVKPADVKPADVKPADVKPAEVKPADVKPADKKDPFADFEASRDANMAAFKDRGAASHTLTDSMVNNNFALGENKRGDIKDKDGKTHSFNYSVGQDGTFNGSVDGQRYETKEEYQAAVEALKLKLDQE